MATCSIEGCTLKATRRKMYAKCYMKWWRKIEGGKQKIVEVCSIDGCDNPVNSLGWCSKHYMRWRKYGCPSFVIKEMAEHGAPQEFIKMALNHQDKVKCLFWPFATDGDGYAIYKNRNYKNIESQRVARYICEKIHGPPPSTIHQTAHNCGKGHLGCINPHHSEWKTPTENQADRIIHGTDNRGERSSKAILNWEKVKDIRSMQHLTAREVGSKFGVTTTTIYNIWKNKIWKI